MKALQLKGYQENSVLSAEPTRLTLLLYQGSVKFIKSALMSLESKNFEETHVAILRAHGIISELMATLDFERGGEIAKNLERLYDYALRELIEADIKKDASHLELALRVVEPLADAWEEAFFKKPVAKPINKPSSNLLPGVYNFTNGQTVASPTTQTELKLPKAEPSETPPAVKKLDISG